MNHEDCLHPPSRRRLLLRGQGRRLQSGDARSTRHPSEPAGGTPRLMEAQRSCNGQCNKLRECTTNPRALASLSSLTQSGRPLRSVANESCLCHTAPTDLSTQWTRCQCFSVTSVLTLSVTRSDAGCDLLPLQVYQYQVPIDDTAPFCYYMCITDMQLRK